MAEEMEKQLEEAIHRIERRREERRESKGNPKNQIGSGDSGKGFKFHGIHTAGHPSETGGGCFENTHPERFSEQENLVESDVPTPPVIDSNSAIPLPDGRRRRNDVRAGTGRSFPMAGLLEDYRWLNLLLGAITIIVLIYVVFHFKAITDAIFFIVLRVITALASVALVIIAFLIFLLYLRMRRRRRW